MGYDTYSLIGCLARIQISIDKVVQNEFSNKYTIALGIFFFHFIPVMLQYLVSSVLVINHPIDTEFVLKTAEISSPKHILNGHFYFASYRKFIKKALSFFS